MKSFFETSNNLLTGAQFGNDERGVEQEEKKEKKRTMMRPSKSWVATTPQSSFGAANSTTAATAKSSRRIFWLAILSIATVMVLVDCWWNERIWSMNVRRRDAVAMTRRNAIAVGTLTHLFCPCCSVWRSCFCIQSFSQSNTHRQATFETCRGTTTHARLGDMSSRYSQQ